MLLNLEQSRRSSRRRRVANAVETDDRLLREAAAGTQARTPASGSLAPLRHLPILQDDSGSLRSRFLVPKLFSKIAQAGGPAGGEPGIFWVSLTSRNLDHSPIFWED